MKGERYVATLQVHATKQVHFTDDGLRGHADQALLATLSSTLSFETRDFIVLNTQPAHPGAGPVPLERKR